MFILCFVKHFRVALFMNVAIENKLAFPIMYTIILQYITAETLTIKRRKLIL